MKNPRSVLVFARFWQTLGWLLTLAVIVVTIIPDPPTPPGFLAWDKADHCIAYASLMLWYRQAFAPRWYWVIFLIALGIALEFIQGWSGYRNFEYDDMLANTLGVGCGLALASTVLGRIVPWLDQWLVAQRQSA